MAMALIIHFAILRGAVRHVEFATPAGCVTEGARITKIKSELEDFRRRFALKNSMAAFDKTGNAKLACDCLVW